MNDKIIIMEREEETDVRVDEWMDDQDREEAWGVCGLCGGVLYFEDGDFCAACGNPIDDVGDAI